MGMSASQARLLSLQARQSNLEYQGQQINQARSILSQQCTALYNSLLSMTVPTPPSTTDYQKVEYTGTLGATKYSFCANDIKPGNNGEYKAKLSFSDYGQCLTRNKGYAQTSVSKEEVKNGQRISVSDTVSGTIEKNVKGYYLQNNSETNADAETGTGNAPQEGKVFFKKQKSKPTSGDYYVMNEEGTALVQGGKGNVDNEDRVGQTYFILCEDPTQWNQNTCIKVEQEAKDVTVEVDTAATVKISQSDLANLYEMDSDGNITKAEAGVDYIVDKNGNVILQGKNDFFLDNNQGSDTAYRASQSGYTIGGYAAMTMEEYKATLGEKDLDTYNGYVTAINNMALKDEKGNPYTEDDFMIYVDNNGKAHFALKNDVKDNDTCVTYDYLANGNFTNSKEFDNVKLDFDPSTGRILKLSIPSNEKGPDGKPLTWSTIDLKSSTVTDEVAYQDAYNDYEYQQYLYDQKNKEINAKTEIIQQEDRNLELKLQRLDNERTQITTEIEAVEKVINDNIEASYKTFSG